jgi:hypothetical protein
MANLSVFLMCYRHQSAHFRPQTYKMVKRYAVPFVRTINLTALRTKGTAYLFVDR